MYESKMCNVVKWKTDVGFVSWSQTLLFLYGTNVERRQFQNCSQCLLLRCDSKDRKDQSFLQNDASWCGVVTQTGSLVGNQLETVSFTKSTSNYTYICMYWTHKAFFSSESAVLGRSVNWRAFFTAENRCWLDKYGYNNNSLELKQSLTGQTFYWQPILENRDWEPSQIESMYFNTNSNFFYFLFV